MSKGIGKICYPAETVLQAKQERDYLRNGSMSHGSRCLISWQQADSFEVVLLSKPLLLILPSMFMRCIYTHTMSRTSIHNTWIVNKSQGCYFAPYIVYDLFTYRKRRKKIKEGVTMRV